MNIPQNIQNPPDSRRSSSAKMRSHSQSIAFKNNIHHKKNKDDAEEEKGEANEVSDEDEEVTWDSRRISKYFYQTQFCAS